MLFLVGCDGTGPNRYYVDCLVIDSDVELSPEVVAHNIQVAKESMEDIVPNFCEVFGGTRIEIRKGFADVGYYDIFQGVVLDERMWSLPHELLHAWDTSHLAIGTRGHHGWETNGYYAAVSKYHKAVKLNADQSK